MRKKTTTGRWLTRRGFLSVLITATFVALGFHAALPAQAAEPVSLHSGLISGETLDASMDLQAFRGIPYAAPPVGALRWQPPQDVLPWKGVRECVEFGAVAPQPFGLTGLVGDPLPDQDEDCLFLNIWTTQAGRDAKKPVMVWIHGGGFSVGWSNQSAYEGSEFAKRGIVLVTINYRLGPLGFLAHPALSAESDHNSSGNYAMLDQIAALTWIQKNIAAFGGDPGNVTIFGESAGGSIVNALCTSPLAKGLIHKGIAQSPGITDGQYAHLTRPTKYTRSAEEIGESWAARFLNEDSDDLLTTLRRVPAKELIEKASGFSGKVVIDGWFMEGDALDLFAEGKQHDIPLMVGTNADEGTIFLGSYPYETVEAYRKGMEEKFDTNADAILALYPVASDKDIPGAINLLITDGWFLRGATEMLRGMAKASSPAYQYVFTQENSFHPEKGAFHSAEMCYVFNTLHPEAERSDNPKLAKAMIEYWAQFAKTGNPNGAGLPVWPEYKIDSARYLELGEEIKAGSAYRHKWLDVLNSIH